MEPLISDIGDALVSAHHVTCLPVAPSGLGAPPLSWTRSPSGRGNPVGTRPWSRFAGSRTSPGPPAGVPSSSAPAGRAYRAGRPLRQGWRPSACPALAAGSDGGGPRSLGDHRRPSGDVSPCRRRLRVPDPTGAFGSSPFRCASQSLRPGPRRRPPRTSSLRRGLLFSTRRRHPPSPFYSPGAEPPRRPAGPRSYPCAAHPCLRRGQACRFGRSGSSRRRSRRVGPSTPGAASDACTRAFPVFGPASVATSVRRCRTCR